MAMDTLGERIVTQSQLVDKVRYSEQVPHNLTRPLRRLAES